MKRQLIAVLAGFLIAIVSSAAAQGPDPDPAAAPDQAPAQDSVDSKMGAARVSMIHGDVSTQRGDSGEWAAAALNAPLVAGDRISTGDRSRTEVQLDYANLLRLDEHSQANIVALTRNQIQIQLGQGQANYSVFKNSEADAEIDTPNVAIHPDRSDGSYRILVAEDGRTEVIVRRGSADISTPQGSTRVEKGQMITIQGTGDQTQYKVAEAPGKDDFDRWNIDRDNMIRNAQAWRHTNHYYTGAEDLDAYGHWTDVPDYGSVWVPAVEPGWAPYRAGRWVWEPGWGWTWVSYEPWGWAPYHYGRWMMIGGSWGWWPGPIYADPYYYPVWAPAYVSFFGFGGGVGFGFGFGGGWGSIGWLPIGPCDHFYPWWGGYRSRFNVVNITNITNITNINNRGGWRPLHGGETFSNLRHAVNDPGFRRAISTVPANDFGRGRMPARPVTNEMFRNAHLVNGNLPVVPTRQSLQASGRPAAPSTISNRAQNQHFFSNSRTPAARPASFDQEQARMQSNIRQNSRFTPINGNQMGGGNQRSLATEGNARFGQPARPGMNSNPGRNEVQRPVNPRSSNAGPGNNASNSEWHRFGGPSGQSGAGNSPRSTAPANNSQPRSFGGDRSSAPSGRSTGNSTWNSAPRPGNGNANERVAAPSRQTNNGGGWQRFPSTPSRPSAGESMSRTPQNESWRSPSRAPAYDSPRGYRNDSRPPLNMRQPIVTPRGGSYGRPSYGGGSYGGNRGGYSTPSRGGYSAPSNRGGGGGAPHGGGSAPSHSGGGGGSSHSSGSGHHGR